MDVDDDDGDAYLSSEHCVCVWYVLYYIKAYIKYAHQQRANEVRICPACVHVLHARICHDSVGGRGGGEGGGGGG